MFNFIKKALSSVYQQFTSKAQALFKKSTIDQATLLELEKILLSADTGIHTTRAIIKHLQEDFLRGKLESGTDLEHALAHQLKSLLHTVPQFQPTADVYLLVGINGSGKTTCAAKLGNWLTKQERKQALFVAGDTFRAAAVQQLSNWAQKLSIPVITGKENQDPSSVIFAGCEAFKAGSYNSLIIDTAGRLQTKLNLMKELEKIKRTINKQLPDKTVVTLLTIDAMLGQNSFEQAKLFNESTLLDGIILTKMDGTGKGGIVFSIVQELCIPVAFISYGEQIDQIKLFDADQYVNQLLEE